MDNQHFEAWDLPADQDEAAWGIIRRFGWNPSIRDDNGDVRLLTGDQVVARFDTVHDLRVFVSGMSTVLVSLPPEAVAIVDQVGEPDEYDDRPDWWTLDLP